MKKIINTLIAVALIAGAILLAYNFIWKSEVFYEPTGEITTAEMEEAFALLSDSLQDGRYSYFEYLATLTPGQGSLSIEADERLGYEDETTLTLDVKEAGAYELYVTYQMGDQVLNNSTISLTINDQVPFYEAATLDLPIQWSDVDKNFSLDSYGDEALPLQEPLPGPYVAPLYNNLYYAAEPLWFELKAGKNTITIKNVSSSPFTLTKVMAKAPKALPSYEAYQSTGGERTSQELVINATQYVQKNSSYVRLMALNSPTATPFDPVDKKLNIIAAQSWEDPGKELVYEVEVEQAGAYALGIHYSNPKDEYDVFRTLRIDGEIPFQEVKNYAFPATGENEFLYHTLSDEAGKPYYFNLSPGRHRISLRADYEPVADEVRRLQLVIDHINQFSLDIRKITGREIDKNRTWKLTQFLPDTGAYLEAYDTLIKYSLQELMVYSDKGAASATLSYLQKALYKLDEMKLKPDELPLYFEDLYSGSGSVNQMLGDAMESLTEQPMALNEMTFYQGTLDKRDNATWFASQWAGFERFVSSFTSDKYVVRNDDEMLNIWVNRPITHVDTLQKLVDAEFTPLTGIEVKISVMPDANKLVLASAAGEAPDIAMGLLSYMPFDLAIRGAALDLSQFDDFWTVADQFTPGAFVPYVLDDKVYALPETLEFFTTVYRKDIFNSLGFEVPNTWEEVTELLPELQRYGMNFYHPIAGGGSLKWFFQTSPFIYQNGGQLYTPDGLRVAIDQQEAVEGLTYLSKLFTTYSLPEQEPVFYNSFRYGTLPIGVADFVTYMQIKNAAPELVGQWALAPYPAMEDADGNLNRWYIANGRGSVILEDTDKKEEAWTFLKWWMSEEVQTTYSYTLQSIYGPEYLWLSGNVAAVQNSPIDMADKLVILDQVKWLRDVPRTPGQYMLERGLSDIWNKSVYDGVPTRIAIDRQVITINREIQRKMIEFGYLDEAGEVLIPYKIRDIDWIIQQIETRGNEDEE